MWISVINLQIQSHSKNRKCPISLLFQIDKGFIIPSAFHRFPILWPILHINPRGCHFVHYNHYCVIMQRLSKVSGELGGKQQFRYTTGGGCLTLEQREFYEENGYIVIRKFLKDEDIEKWRSRFIEYCDNKHPP